MEIFTPEKWLWTDEDLHCLPFGDTFVHGIGFTVQSLLLDIDFLVHWEPPAAGETYARYWRAPATLCFEDVSEASLKLEPAGGLIILEITREKPRRRPDGKTEWLWEISECCSEGFSFRATGFTLSVRAPGRLPVAYPACLSLEERGGISFDVADRQG